MAPERKLYGLWASAPTMRAALILWELGLDFELVFVKVLEGAHKRPDYLAKNPFGLVPFLDDGDVKIFESVAIMRYLAENYSGTGPSLLGNNKVERALVNQRLEAMGQNFNRPAAQVIRPTAFPYLFGPRDEAVVQAALEELAKVLDIYEERLEKSKYLAGNFVSLADLGHVPFIFLLVEYCPEFVALVRGRKHVSAWWEDITARPAWKKVAHECTNFINWLQQNV